MQNLHLFGFGYRWSLFFLGGVLGCGEEMIRKCYVNYSSCGNAFHSSSLTSLSFFLFYLYTISSLSSWDAFLTPKGSETLEHEEC